MNTPFFILGNPRSGTTLLRLMLNSHPGVIVPPECGYALWLYDEFGGADFRSEQVVRAFVTRLVKTRKFETWGLDEREISVALLGVRPETYCEAVWHVHGLYGKGTKAVGAIVGDKNNFYIAATDKLKAAFPSAKCILIVRDGRDVACSYRSLGRTKMDSQYRPDLPFDIPSIALAWRNNNAAALDLVGGDLFLIRYEDLVLQPEAQLRKVCAFLGIPYSSAMLGYHLLNDEPLEFMPWKGKTRDALSESSIGRYRSELTAEEVGAFEAVAADMLERLEYSRVCGTTD